MRSPLRERRSLWVPRRRSTLAAMRARRGQPASGTHDFAALPGAPARGGAHARVRTPPSGVEIAGEAGGELALDFEGDGFLRHMVRNLVGTLLEVGQGRRPPESIPAAIAGGARSQPWRARPRRPRASRWCASDTISRVESAGWRPNGLTRGAIG